MALLFLWVGLLAPGVAPLPAVSPCLNDVHEPNPVRARAAAAGPRGAAGRLCADDVDWFVADLRPGRYRVQLRGAPGARLAWFRPRRRRPTFGLRAGQARTLVVRARERHRFVVRGAPGAADYVVAWQAQ